MMENEAESPALKRLEDALSALESALVNRRDDSALAQSAEADARSANAALTDLSDRHGALKKAVAQCLGDLDGLLQQHEDAG